MTENTPDLSLVVPLYNEEGNIPAMVRDVRDSLNRESFTWELILVDNGSNDGTARLIADCVGAHSSVRRVDIPCNLGYGWGVITGLKAARGKYVGWSDGDNQVPSAVIVSAYKRAIAESLDVCVGNPRRSRASFSRRVVSSAYIVSFNLLFLSRFRAINGKPKIMKRGVYDSLRLDSKDWFIDAEVMIKARKLRLKTGFVNFELRPREKGESHIRLRTLFEFVCNLLHRRLIPYRL